MSSIRTAAMPLLVIAPGRPLFERWHRDHGLTSPFVQLIHREEQLRGIADRHVVIVDNNDCPRGLVALAWQRAAPARLTIHETTTAERPGLSTDELRSRYGDQVEMVDHVRVLQFFGINESEREWAVAFRYATLEALEAFTAGNRRHHGYTTIGPLIGPDSALYGITILKRPAAAAS